MLLPLRGPIVVPSAGLDQKVIWNNWRRPLVALLAMEKPGQRSLLLPGVRDAGSPPAVVFESRRVIAGARRRAVFRDALDLLLLGCVDGLFIEWPRAHVPMLDRYESVMIIAAVNAAMLTYLYVARTFPAWRARRVASTWCANERTRFFKR